MAHFAELDSNNIVLRVLVVGNNDCLDDNNNESESVGIIFLQNLFGSDTVWKQTSYNGNMRKNYAGIGHTYDQTRDAFIAPKPFTSWVLNETTCRWQAPIAYPTDGEMYQWNETDQQWDVRDAP
tara:strand:- start:473 stop:844 length:372 start_codon:yes stop_codon:yes gene_type:complete